MNNPILQCSVLGQGGRRSDRKGDLDLLVVLAVTIVTIDAFHASMQRSTISKVKFEDEKLLVDAFTVYSLHGFTGLSGPKC